MVVPVVNSAINKEGSHAISDRCSGAGNAGWVRFDE